MRKVVPESPEVLLEAARDAMVDDPICQWLFCTCFLMAQTYEIETEEDRETAVELLQLLRYLIILRQSEILPGQIAHNTDLMDLISDQHPTYRDWVKYMTSILPPPPKLRGIIDPQGKVLDWGRTMESRDGEPWTYRS